MKGDYQNTIDFAREQGFEQGHEAGVAEGMERGMEKGMEKGKIDIAQNLIAMDMTPEQVAKATGLSVEAVQNL